MRRVLLAILFVTVIMVSNSTAAMNVLVLSGNIGTEEFPVLSTFTNEGGETLTFEETGDRSLPGLSNADILWIGQGEVCENAYFFDAATENKIKDFVASGGIAISVGQDTDGGRPCEIGWLTAPTLGVERSGTESFEITNAPEVGSLFTTPNNITEAHFDDSWTQSDNAYKMLATINDGQDIGIALLFHGDGVYIVTGLEDESSSDVSINTPILENLLYYAVGLSQTTAVEYHGKLATTWAGIKNQ